MNSLTELSIRKNISADLALRSFADRFFQYLNSLDQEKIIVDFSGIRSMSRSFAHEYCIKKRESKKMISEIKVPDNIMKMFSIVKESGRKPLIDFNSAEITNL